ncbi:T9SS type A sorting domain-containing protein [Tamlana sp. I1]|uniref:T9SS type A sorting domain-containing protein n=1 Tax=Tamlana sp. I1 TaxID=2762061 RepID=UPI00188E71C3|nr:T9SS type A sorting domain-containing protein [Tamlana sp. I1]
MKKITFLLLAIIPLFGFTQNLLSNPTFVDATDWSDNNAGTGQGIVSPADSHTADGSTSYKIVSNGSFNSQVRGVNISGLAAGDYLFSYWVKGDKDVNTLPQIRDNGTTSNINGVNYTIMNDGTWEYVEQTFTISGTGTISARIFIKNNVNGTAIQVDDVSLTYVPPAGNVLTVNVVGAGTVARTLDKLGYDPTDTETLTANASTHWNFDSWSGDLTGTTNPDNILMDTDKTVTANFVINPSFDYAFTFDTDNDLEGWTVDPQVSVSSHTGGQVTLALTANQWARFNLFDFPIPTGSYNKATIILKSEEASTDQLAITAGTDVTNNTMTYPLTSGSNFQTFEINLTEFAAWTGDANFFRIRVADSNNPTASGRPSVDQSLVIDSVVFTFDPSLSSESFDTKDFAIYPNPASSHVTIKGVQAISEVSIFDVMGKQVLKTKSLTNDQLNVSHLKTGVYIIRVTDANNYSTVKKLVKK